MIQSELFPPVFPVGLSYREDFLSIEEEEALLAAVRTLPLQEAAYKQFTARRRTFSYGSSYDFSANRSVPAPELAPFLHPLRTRVAEWCGLPAESFVQALIAEYPPGAQLGWHRDVPEFEAIAGISLLARCRLRLRQYPLEPARRKDVIVFDLAPRSAYVLLGDARWRWQHSIPPVKALRYSITLRTVRTGTRVR